MRAQRIHPAAYGALTEALSTIFWYKQDLARFLRNRSKGHPELIAGIDFNGYKRVSADEFVDRLMEGEDRYRDLTLAMMLEIVQMPSFPSLKRQSDAEKLLAQATEAVADLRVWIERLQGLLEERARVEAEQAQEEEQRKHRRGFSEKLAELKEEFLQLQVEPNRQRAGREFETFLNSLFQLFDMQPRLGYELEYEQIDGSFTFDTDDYVLEAKWWKDAVEAGQLREFNDKVRRKGKNALGLFISVSGFTSGARAAFREGTSFLTMDGTDLFCILDDRLRLDDLLGRKKRHANETGNCYFPARLMLEE
ncbi:restriction endonuclease [Streptomyces sp. NPDC059017]|uniref:restriction endonuclease n=1 Tax=Streptomyces sp. NPDC059017 TaxID=3346700 RepID=UPI00368CAED5